MIIDKLISKIIDCENPSVVGLDPNLDFIPEYIKNKNFEEFGETLKGVSKSFYEFNKIIIDNIFDVVPAIKPQIAMYEQLGVEGLKCYIDTIEYGKSKGLIVIGDIKRGDIQSTAKAYSDGHIGKVKVGKNNFTVYNEDFITLNPYLGSDSIIPYLDDCKEYEKGLFVLIKTSNPKSPDFQNLQVDGMNLYEKVGLHVQEWGSKLIGNYNFSSVGGVVGATYKEEGEALRKLLPNTFFLVPGYGAQGGTAQDLKVCFNKDGIGSIVNSSRGIIAAYKNDSYNKKFNENQFGEAAREAVLDMKKDLGKHINTPRR